ncbi:AAA family ATPase [Rossellomorea marisflavi]|uniref:AAA family ATPase n=1 Tax=Rossellomorea marisflavi TaxID=189381 RepID=UPI003D2F24CB
MKPLQLTMQAFGPYASREVIDFRELENRTMFVISGKTGAGKTTIFDGISYAIYGKASGEDRSPVDLRSQFAKEDELTEVELLFTLRGETYKIWRSPQQEKKKARGEGFTTMNARSELYRLGGDGEELLAANVREVDEKIRSMIQLDANQFRQILMIPQGEFRKLLTSDSKDKEIILQRLFHTELYRAVQEQLKEEADLLKHRVSSSVEERTRELLNLRYVDNEEMRELLLSDPLKDQTIMELLPTHIQSLNGSRGKVEEKLVEIQEKRDALQRELAEARSLDEQFKLQEALLQKKGELEGEKPRIDQAEREIQRANYAALLVQQDDYCKKLNKKLKAEEATLEQLMETKKQIEARLVKAKAYFEEEARRQEERDQVARYVLELEGMEKQIQSIDELQRDTAVLKKEQDQCLQNVHTNKKQAEVIRGGIKEREAELEKADDLFEEIHGVEETIREKREKQDLLEELSILIQKEEALSNSVGSLRRDEAANDARLSDARSTYLYLEDKRNSAHADRLSALLETNQPCPVCGSLHHPEPATGQSELPSEVELEAARKAKEELEEAKGRLSIEIGREEGRLQGIQDQCRDRSERLNERMGSFNRDNTQVTLHDIREEIRNLRLKLNQLRSREDRVKVLKDEVKQERLKLEELHEVIQEAEARLEKAKSEYLSSHAKLAEITSSIPENLRSPDAFRTELSNAKRKKEELKRAHEQAQEAFNRLQNEEQIKQGQINDKHQLLTSLQKEMKEERQQFKDMMDKQGFKDYGAYIEAKRNEEQILHLTDQVRKHGEEMRSVHDRLADLGKHLDGRERPDLESLNQSIIFCTEELKMANQELNRIQTDISQNEGIYRRVNDINEGIKELEAQYLTVGHLAEIARGQNTNRITFERYVLASFLEDILLVANERLRKMTSGRYELIRKNDRSKGNLQSGLELLVFDQFTGQERHVKTLSGGESFKASLALALGLADIVQQHAGGVSLETMFIDEGFGTLDPESLDHAIEALMDIQSSGRLVGIISHVPELKERIDARLEVISSQNGSRTEFRISG